MLTNRSLPPLHEFKLAIAKTHLPHIFLPGYETLKKKPETHQRNDLKTQKYLKRGGGVGWGKREGWVEAYLFAGSICLKVV